ncbi:MAG: ABC transporter substrate-binding protein [Rhodospirillaceae bacterium]|nr:ABC transporter substrate-binding protein [Rhodospirillaceae bacterium]MBT6241914.1 ABC transporter substrate-binding protein [Rhodospirillaceae bacterium]MBT7138715.1 ABC transporter substrate-binding protein [Rhodospirillaceae bacterium]
MTIWRPLISFLPAFIVLAGLSFSPHPALSASFEEEATTFVQELAEKAIRELTDKETPRIERIERFRAYFNDHFAVSGIGKWILGRHWRKASEAERAEYLKLFEDLMVVSYVDRFAAYVGEPLHIHKATLLDEKNVTVFSDIHQKDGVSAVRVDWRVARKDELFKVVDVIVEGTSMSNTLRSDFGSIIRQRGGKVAGLLEALREKTDTLNKEEDG